MASICRRAARTAHRTISTAGHELSNGVQWRSSSALHRQIHGNVVNLTDNSALPGARIASVVCSSSSNVHVPTRGRQFGTFRASSPRFDEFVMELPSLGDSITEGTIVEWRKSVGDSVAEDEVIAVVETDKVSVDIRSQYVGVVVKLSAAVDDVVEVGKPLCTIDGDEAAVAKAKEEAAEAEEDAKAPPPEVKKPNLEDAAAGAFMAGADFVAPKKKQHEPLIKFLGKRSLLKQQATAEAEEQAVPARHRHSLGALDVTQIVGGASFGRPLMSEEEMEAVNSGGAECAPKLRYINGSRWA